MTESLASDQVFIRKLTDIIIANLGNEHFGVRELANETGISRYSLARRLHVINRRTPIQFIREIRLGKALEMLHNEGYTVAEVAYRTGFGSPTYFNKCFHAYFGYPPGKAVKGSSINKQPDTAISTFPERSANKFWLRMRVFSIRGILLLIILSGSTGYFIYNKIYKTRTSAELISHNKRISIAVMPFQNMTRDTIWNIWQNGIQESLISSFSNSSDLRVRQRETVSTFMKSKGISEYAAISPGMAGRISKNLDADIFIYGSIKKAGNAIRLDAQLIDTKTNEVLKSFESDGPCDETMISVIIDSLRKEVTDYLVITKLRRGDPLKQWTFLSPSKSPEAIRYYINGQKAVETSDWPTARKWFLQALSIDSTFWAAAFRILVVYGYEGNAEQNLKWVLKLYEKKEQMPLVEQLYVSWAYACNFEPPDKSVKYLKQLEDIDESPNGSYLLGFTYVQMHQYDKAVPEYERSVELCRKWGIKPNLVNSYWGLIYGYYITSQQKKLKKLIKEVYKEIPDEPGIIFWQSVLALRENDTIEVNKYIRQYISNRKANSVSDADIEAELGVNYSELGIADKAEDYFRRALVLAPENPGIMLALGRFLNDNNRKLNEVPELMDKALTVARDKIEYYNCLDTKGWNFYKQGKIREAQEILYKCWDEAPFKLYSIKSHLDEVNNAVAQHL